MARGFCTCKQDFPERRSIFHPPEHATWHYLCDKPVLPPAPEPRPRIRPTGTGWPPDLPETHKLADMHGTAAETAEQAAKALAEVRAAIADLDPPEYAPEDGEAQRIAEVPADAKAELHRGL